MTMKKYAALTLYTLAVIAVSLLPRADMPGHGHVDKVAHFVAYFGMGSMAWYAMPALRLRLLAAVSAVGLGGLLEVVQHFIPGRSASSADAAVNTLGVAVGVAAAAALAPRIVHWITSVTRRLAAGGAKTVEGR